MYSKLEKVIEKYKSIPKPAKATFWAMVCSIIQKGISFITTPIFTRMLTTEQYGICSVFDSWYMIIILFTSLSVYQNSFNNAIIKYDKDKDGYISSVQSLVGLIAIVFGIICIVFKNPICAYTSLPFICIIVMILELIFVPAYSLWMAKNRFEFNYVSVVVGTLVICILSPIIGVIAVHLTPYKAEAKILAFAFVQIIVGIGLFIYNIYKGRKIYDKEIWVYTLKFNIPLIPYYLSSIILSQADRIMINSMEGASNAAIYSLAYTLSLIMTIISNAINQSLIPYIYKKIKANMYESIASIVNFSCIVVAVMNLVIMFLGPELIAFFGTKEYIEAKWVIPPVSASVFFIFLYQMFSVIQMYWGKTNTMVMSSVGVAVLNIVLNYFGIKYFGFIAAGYTTLVSYMILTVTYYIQYSKVVSKNMERRKVYDIKIMSGISILVLGSVLVTLTLYNLPDVIRYIVVLLVAFGGFMERRKIIGIIKIVKEK